jgi:diguanylate cyclase
MTGTYSPALVALSFLVAVAASYVALALAARITAVHGWAVGYWLLGGAVAMGTGIWSMHFIGMLAFHLPIPMSYDVGTTVASLLLAIVVSGFALFIVSRNVVGLRTLALAGPIMGLGIAGMHYVGMAAMEVVPPIRYDPALVLASILIAVAASVAALALAFELRAQSLPHLIWKRFGAALIMGTGIVGMHYTGMAAAQFAPNAICTATSGQINPDLLAMAVATSCLLFLGATMLVLTVDVRLAQQLDKANARIAELARTDPLTGLANRRTFLEHLEGLFRARMRNERSFAVHCLDLDGFKDVNDTLGHPMGDALLVEAAARLDKTVRKSDLVARLGGDEFAILQTGVADPPAAGMLAAKVGKALAAPYLIDGHALYVTASIGVATADARTDTPEALLTQADRALYRAKDDGRNCYKYYNSELDRQDRMRTLLAQELHLAIERGELELLYQPQVHINSGRIAGLETRVRWNHPTRGSIEPSLFIPIAEKSGTIAAVGGWILDQTCRQQRQWQDQGIAPPFVAVDISYGQLQVVADLAGDMSTALAKWSLSLECIEIELTESVLMQAAQKNKAKLDRLRELGFRLAIDDFGIGYSSLSLLADYPINRLKIASRLVSGVVDNERSATVVCATVRLAQQLGVDVVADGVDTEDQVKFLVFAGCGQAQGPFFGAPVPAHEASLLLKRDSVKSATTGPSISKSSAA